MAFIGGQEMLIIGGIVFLLFGASQIPRLARSIGRARKEFETGLKEGETSAPEDDAKSET
ncbi:MAG: twin-arginine translocase TatA/TatE family subunit [Lentisphaeria bacterium]|tara:strand:- start:113 stop:292 length:180 start_codon:yes stop_codon:yes gene_type:complete